VSRKSLAKSIHQSRQLITHGHIAIGDKAVFAPSYLVLKNEEEKVAYALTSPVNNSEHPLRKMMETEAVGGAKNE
jgi:small subunit ribosomal protein S4